MDKLKRIICPATLMLLVLLRQTGSAGVEIVRGG